MNGKDITKASVRERSTSGMSHIPEDRHKHGLVLDYSLEDNLVLQRYFEPQFTSKAGLMKRKEIREYSAPFQKAAGGVHGQIHRDAAD